MLGRTCRQAGCDQKQAWASRDASRVCASWVECGLSEGVTKPCPQTTHKKRTKLATLTSFAVGAWMKFLAAGTTPLFIEDVEVTTFSDVDRANEVTIEETLSNILVTRPSRSFLCLLHDQTGSTTRRRTCDAWEKTTCLTTSLLKRRPLNFLLALA